MTIKIVAENNKFALSQFLEAKGPKLRCQQCHIPPKPLRENPFLLLPASSGCLATLGIPWFVHASLQSFQQIFEPGLVHVIPISYRTESERSQTGTFEVQVKILFWLALFLRNTGPPAFQKPRWSCIQLGLLCQNSLETKLCLLSVLYTVTK